MNSIKDAKNNEKRPSEGSEVGEIGMNTAKDANNKRKRKKQSEVGSSDVLEAEENNNEGEDEKKKRKKKQSEVSEGEENNKDVSYAYAPNPEAYFNMEVEHHSYKRSRDSFAAPLPLSGILKRKRAETASGGGSKNIKEERKMISKEETGDEKKLITEEKADVNVSEPNPSHEVEV